MEAQVIANPDNVRFVAEDLDHPEGLNFGPDGRLYAGGEAGQIYRVDPARGEVMEVARTGGFHLGVAPDGSSNVYACDIKSRSVVCVSPEGRVSTCSKGADERPMQIPNYCVFDADGNLYVSDSGDYWHPEGTGCIFKVSPEGTTEVFHPGPFRFANGLGLDPTNEYLYVVQSTAPDVVRVPLKPSTSRPAAPERVVALDNCVPDGLAFDRQGRLYIACYTPDAIYRVGTDGVLETVVEDPTGELLARPTNVALHNRTLYFANLGGWHIGAVSVDADPAPLHYPQLPDQEKRAEWDD